MTNRHAGIRTRTFAYQANALLTEPQVTHCQQCNDTMYMLLAAFCRNNFAITIFTSRSLWASFVCCVLEIVDFQDAPFLRTVCRTLLLLKTKKWGETWTLTSADDLTLHAKALHRVPVTSSLKQFLDQLWRSSIDLQRLVAKMHILESLLSTTDCACGKSSKLHAQGRSGPQRSKTQSKGLRPCRSGH